MSTDEQAAAAERVRQGETIPPAFKREAFHCVYCVVYATHSWTELKYLIIGPRSMSPGVWFARCRNCSGDSYWLEPPAVALHPLMVHPIGSHVAPPAHVDMPDDVRDDYAEAASIVERSPRGAGALLRLALQKLMPHLGEKGDNINADIASLVGKGLDPGVQQALDALRVIGNNTVHPLELDLRDDVDTVGALFGLVNYIVEQRISHPKKLEQLYQGLPAGARAAIARRDSGS